MTKSEIEALLPRGFTAVVNVNFIRINGYGRSRQIAGDSTDPQILAFIDEVNDLGEEFLKIGAIVWEMNAGQGDSRTARIEAMLVQRGPWGDDAPGAA